MYAPSTTLHAIVEALPFARWRANILGPFSQAFGQRNCLGQWTTLHDEVGIKPEATMIESKGINFMWRRTSQTYHC